MTELLNDMSCALDIVSHHIVEHPKFVIHQTLVKTACTAHIVKPVLQFERQIVLVKLLQIFKVSQTCVNIVRRRTNRFLQTQEGLG